METETKKIRVCFVSPKAYPIFNPDVQSVFGGAEVDLYLIATELAKDDRFDVQFVVGDYGQPEIEQREDVTLIKSLDVNKNMILQGGKIWKALRRADADIYMHEACSLGTTLIAWFCKMKDRSFVYRTASTREINGFYFREHPICGVFVKWAFKNADFLITQNEQDVQSLMSTLNLPAIVIPNACHIPETLPAINNTILWVGRSLPVKRPDIFIRLAGHFPNNNFVMICPEGTGDNHYKNLLNKAKSFQNLTFLKHVPFHEIDHYFEQAYIFVNTSDSEGFPNTFVQACKSGTSILSLNVNPDNFLDKYQCGFCANGNWDGLTQKLQEWTASEIALKLGENGRKYIEQTHNIRKIIKQYKSLFNQCWRKANPGMRLD
ncbi:MAG: glycosyltransferase family 4 protein [Phycisphaerae bacterium]|nr:glycosyltransferase family 4 protein [Phycisphaerae bacterium]